MTGPAVVLIHGAWAGSWVWNPLLEPFTDAGMRPIPVTLPGVGGTLDEPAELDDVVAAVIGQIADVEGPVVIVGHSGGGVVATNVAEALAERVAGVVYVAGMMLPSGGSFVDACDRAGLTAPVGISRYLEYSTDGALSTVPAEAAATIFFHEAAPDDAVSAARKMVPQRESARLISPTWTPERFGRLPRCYIEATLDRSVPIQAQRQMQDLVPGATQVTLDSDHAPQLSAPAAVASAIIDFAVSVTTHPVR
ncbi:alpha/beta fold hydrolase [Gordonia sp. NPDC003376]